MVACSGGQGSKSKNMFAFLVTTVILTAGTYLLYKYFFADDDDYHSSRCPPGTDRSVCKPKRKPKVEEKKQAAESKEDVKESEPVDEGYLCRIFFGSQSGTAEGFAFDMVAECKTYGFKAEVIDLEEFQGEELAELEAKSLCIFLVATYGEGEPTDNAQDFHNWLDEQIKADSSASLKNVHFAVFGLGNSQYEFFNAMGKFFDDKLEDFGGNRLVERGTGDDDVGSIEDQFEEWKANLWPVLSEKFLGRKIDALNIKFESNIKLSVIKCPVDSGFDVSKFLPYSFDKKTPSCFHEMATSIEYPFSHIDIRRVVFDARRKAPEGIRISPSLLLPSRHHNWMEHVTLATVREKYEVRPSRSDGSTMHVEFDITSLKSSNGLFFRYKSADNLGVVVRNDDVKIAALCQKILGADISTDKELDAILDTVIRIRPLEKGVRLKIPVPAIVSIRNLFAWYLDITSVPSKKQLASLMQFATDEAEAAELKSIIETDGGLTADVRERYWNILKVLERYPSIKVELTQLIEILKPLQPRLYTISSSDKAQPKSVAITAKYEYEPGGLYFAHTLPGDKDLMETKASQPAPTWKLDESSSPTFVEAPDAEGTVSARAESSESNGFVFVDESKKSAPVELFSPCSGLLSPVICDELPPLLGIPGMKRTGSKIEESLDATRTPFVGVCSRYLHTTSVGAKVQVFVTPSSFRLPSHSTPVIMVCAGAGMAPFRAFVQEGNHVLSKGKVTADELADWWLFFGCRWKAVDYIYKGFLEKSKRENGGCLSELKVAFSRDQTEKEYVQDLIRANGEALYRLVVEKKARIYVCGGPAMGNEVRATFTDILFKCGVKFRTKQNIQISQMLKTGQYVQELW